ncbi:MAG: dienelactone hydrolase family protein [Clostridia bacterium]|nr:dienelactone hydrolase family protein [Clostridia bacterium]
MEERMEEKIFEVLPYHVYYPKHFCEDKKYPLVIFLHGAGTRGESTEKLKKNAGVKWLQGYMSDRNYVLLAPHCKSGTWNEWMSFLIRLVDEMRSLPYIDKTRVHLTGNSMGGYGTWALATLRADWFASAMPICGGGIGGFAKNLVDLPIRTFHGLRDKLVDPIESLQMAKAVNNAGGHAELILYPELSHNCWDAAYSDEKNIDWLLSFTTERNKTETESLSGEIYG